MRKKTAVVMMWETKLWVQVRYLPKRVFSHSLPRIKTGNGVDVGHFRKEQIPPSETTAL